MWNSTQKILILILTTTLTGCGLFHSTETQIAVRQIRRSADFSKDGDTLEALDRMLTQRGIPHKRVQFRYDVNARPLILPIGNAGFSLGETPLAWLPASHQIRERTGVIYRDDSNRKHPWWYVDANIGRPIWLPTDTVERQIGFVMHRHVEILSVTDFDGTVTPMGKSAGKDSTTDWNARFRTRHGTDFDPHSSVDIAKMRQLRGY